MRRNRVKKLGTPKPRFNAWTLAESKKYSQYEDILKAKFPKESKITYEQADKAISDYLGRRV